MSHIDDVSTTDPKIEKWIRFKTSDKDSDLDKVSDKSRTRVFYNRLRQKCPKYRLNVKYFSIVGSMLDEFHK